MKAVRDYQNRTLTLSDCSAQEVRLVLEGLVDEPEMLNLFHQILANQEKTTMFEDDVIAKLTAQKTIADGVKALLEQLTVLVKALPTTDPAKQAQILALIDANSQEVSDAIVANTPTTGPVVEPPTPVAG